MPVRSLNSRVFRWPDRDVVHGAVAAWADELRATDGRVRRVGYAGSYARGDWGVGSDLDVVIVLSGSDEPFISRAAAFDTTGLPVPVDLLVYTTDEWSTMLAEGSFFIRGLERDAVWV